MWNDIANISAIATLIFIVSYLIVKAITNEQ